MSIEINEVDYGWHDMEFAYVTDGQAGKVTRGLTAVSYDHKTPVTNNYGGGRDVKSQSVGAYTPGESKLTWFKKDWDNVKSQIGNGWQGAPFALGLRYRNPGEPIHDDRIQGRLVGESAAFSVGDGPLMVDVTVMPSKIVTNGVDPVRQSGA